MAGDRAVRHDPAGEIAEAVVRLIVDETLAGRVMLCVGPKPWPLAELPKRPP